MSIPTPADLKRGRVTWTIGHADGSTLTGAHGVVRFEATAVAVPYKSATVLPDPVDSPVKDGVMTPMSLLVNDPDVWNWRVIPDVGVPWAPFHVDITGSTDLSTAAHVTGRVSIPAVNRTVNIGDVPGLETALAGKTDKTDISGVLNAYLKARGAL